MIIIDMKLTNNQMIGVIGTNWNQIKRELITMWQIVKQVREETRLQSKRV
jgi:hypothetical protein